MIKRVEGAREARKEKKRWAAGALAAGLLLCAMATFYTARTRTAEVVARKRELPIYAVDRDDGKIAISFDAAWGGDKTEKILDILDEFGVKTTFFMVDIWTQRFPGLVKEIAARGHEIGIHALRGGTVDSCRDHRIAMAAAVLAIACRERVMVLGAEAVEKSYPAFWADYRRLGGEVQEEA